MPHILGAFKPEELGKIVLVALYAAGVFRQPVLRLHKAAYQSAVRVHCTHEL